MKSGKEEDFISFARETLEQDLQGMDAATRSRLAGARAAAMASGSSRRWMRIVPVASVALAATAALLIFLWPVAQGLDRQQLALEDIDVLGSEADLDVLADPDFYRWLASYPANPPPPGTPPASQEKARSAANGKFPGWERTTGLSHRTVPLWATLDGRLVMLHALELVKVGPAFMRLAKHPVQYGRELTNFQDRPLRGNDHAG